MKNVLMNTEMTKAILEGRKTQTRRAIKVDAVMCDNPTILEQDSCVKFRFGAGGCQNYSSPPLFINSKYQKGDIVWVREPVKVSHVGFDSFYFTATYLADGKEIKIDTPKRFVKYAIESDTLELIKSPKWLDEGKGIPNGCIKEMARIFLKITDVRVERLQDISHEDILKEGVVVNTHSLEKYRKTYEEFDLSVREAYDLEFEELWSKTAPEGYRWDDNPYVFIYEFERVNKVRSKIC